MHIGLNVNLYLREYFCPRKLGKFIRGSRGVITVLHIWGTPISRTSRSDKRSFFIVFVGAALSRLSLRRQPPPPLHTFPRYTCLTFDN